MTSLPNTNKVILPSEIWSRGELVLRSLLMGLAAGFAGLVAVGAGLKQAVLPPGQVVSLAVLCVVIAGPLALLNYYRFQVRSSVRALLAGAGFGIGLTILLQLLIVMMFQKGSVARALYFELACAAATLLTAAGSWCTWQLIKHRSPNVLIQNGTLCPNCAYSLTGNTSLTCPECGRNYAPQELETDVALRR